MGAKSVTGVGGPGTVRNWTTKELATLANAPSILASGKATTAEMDNPVSPERYEAVVTLPIPLPGTANDYVVILTAYQGTSPFIQDYSVSDGYFRGFTIWTEEDQIEVNYIVVPVGIRPAL